MPTPTAITTGRIVGVLFLVGTLAGALSLAALPPLGEAPEVLRAIGEGSARPELGAALVLVMGLALAFVPLVAYPVLRAGHERLALGYVVFRGGLETAAYLALALGWLVLASLGRAHVAAGGPAVGHLEAAGALVLDGYEVLAHVGLTVVFAIGALLFNGVLLRARLVPRWLAGWGLAGAGVLLPTLALVLLGIVEPGSATQVAANVPIALQELVLAGWLITTGFPAPHAVGAHAPATEKRTHR